MGSTDALQAVAGPVVLVVTITTLLFLLGSALTPGFGLPGTTAPEPTGNQSNQTDTPDTDVRSLAVNGTVVEVVNASTMIVEISGEETTVQVAGVATPASSVESVDVSRFSGVASNESRSCLADVGSAGTVSVRDRFEGERVLVLPASGDRVGDGSVEGFVYVESDTSVSVSSHLLQNGYGIVSEVPRPRGADVDKWENLKATFELREALGENGERGVWAC